MKLLLLEQSDSFGRLMANALEKEGYKIDRFVDGKGAMDVLMNGYQCFILDVNAPSFDGISILETIRMYNSSIPVIMISSNHELEMIKLSYEAGCDEFLKKPFFMYELVQRVKKLCDFGFHSLDLGDGFVYECCCRSLCVSNKEIRLAKKEILLLELLAKDIQRVVSFEEIEEYVWEGKPTNLINIRALVKRVRKKIPKRAIVIVKGMGYSLNSNQCRVLK